MKRKMAIVGIAASLFSVTAFSGVYAATALNVAKGGSSTFGTALQQAGCTRDALTITPNTGYDDDGFHIQSATLESSGVNDISACYGHTAVLTAYDENDEVLGVAEAAIVDAEPQPIVGNVLSVEAEWVTSPLPTAGSVSSWSVKLIPFISSTSKTTPSSPLNVTASMLGQSVIIDWDAPNSTGGTRVRDYEVQYSEDGSTWVTYADGLSLITQATIPIDPDLTRGLSYYFRVAAVNTIGASLYGATANPLLVATPPAAITSLVLTPGDESILVEWTAPDDGGSPITEYAISIAESASGPFTTPIGTTGPGVTSFDTASALPLLNGTTYYVKVAASNAVGSTDSVVESATPLAP